MIVVKRYWAKGKKRYINKVLLLLLLLLLLFMKRMVHWDDEENGESEMVPLRKQARQMIILFVPFVATTSRLTMNI